MIYAGASGSAKSATGAASAFKARPAQAIGSYFGSGLAIETWHAGGDMAGYR